MRDDNMVPSTRLEQERQGNFAKLGLHAPDHHSVPCASSCLVVRIDSLRFQQFCTGFSTSMQSMVVLQKQLPHPHALPELSVLWAQNRGPDCKQLCSRSINSKQHIGQLDQTEGGLDHGGPGLQPVGASQSGIRANQ